MDKNQKEEILKQTVVEEEQPKLTLADKLKEQKKKKKKKRQRLFIFLVVFVLISYPVWWLFKPFKASAKYGTCKSLLELYIPYPHTLYVSEINQMRDGSLRLWYTHIDAFGEYRLENFECNIQNNPETGRMSIKKIKVHKVFLEPDKLKHLSSALPYFEANPVIMNWPAPLPDSLNDLHFEFDKFRKIIINPNKHKQ